MANYWAIEIGISQYRFLPPLSYAQRDAELLHQALLQSGFVAQRCSLLADQITQTTMDTGFPSGRNIQAALTRIQQVIQPEDLLICFFSGYGLQHQGKDYLLPIEADPRNLAETGLAVDDLLNQLKACPSENILLLLDANRSQLGLHQAQAGLHQAKPGFGAETMRLAEAVGIAVLLSCQPDQFSHEPLTLRQGIFTAALVTALSDCMTLEQLVSRLSEQLPQLSEEFWRPRQDLQAVVPAHLRYCLLLPESEAARPALKVLSGGAQPERATAQHLAQLESTARVSSSGRASRLPRSGFRQVVSSLFAQAFPAAESDGRRSTLASSSMTDAATLTFADGLETAGLSDHFFWRRLLAQGGLIAGILLFGVVLRNSSSLINSAESSDSGLPLSTAALSNAQSQSAISPKAATSPAKSTPAVSPSPTDQSGAAISELSAAPVIAIDPALLMQAAQSALDAQQYDEANRQLVQIPVGQRSVEQQQLLEQVNRELLNQAKTMLIRIRNPMPENQVSDLVEAIKVARLIKADQPLYSESQQNIDRWSRLIMDMAQGRAERANGSSAADAADNYTKAISAARLVPTDQPVYEQAQQAISLWSQKILDLANTRASNGELDLAIQIGELVPPNTPDYAAAQEAIANWRNQPSPVN